MDGRDDRMLSKEELLRMLLVEDETYHDEGRDLYMDEVLAELRKNLGTDDGFLFGRGISAETGKHAALYGSNALVVCGRSQEASGLKKHILSQLDENGVSYSIYGGAVANPTLDSVDDGVAAAAEGGCDMVVAVGGGSQMDCAKAIAMMSASGGSIRDYYGKSSPRKSLPVVAVPTTCGTGSEVNGICVLTDPETHDKTVLSSQSAVPKAALVDPSLMETMSAEIMASVSFDAFCHLVESYTQRGEDPVYDEMCQRGLMLLKEGLLRANRDLHDAPALDMVTYASSLAGKTIFARGTSAPHALEHPLSGMRNIPHGRGLAAITPEIYVRSVPGRRDRFAEVSRMFGGKDENDIRQTVGGIIAELGLEDNISDLGFSGDDIPELTEIAMRTAGRKLTNNPVEFGKGEVEAVYRACL